jgi:hypothetical protein
MIPATQSAFISDYRDVEVDAVLAPIEQSINDELARFRTYLVARGLISPARSVAAKRGVTLSIKRGRTDGSICMRILIVVWRDAPRRDHTNKNVWTIAETKSLNAAQRLGVPTTSCRSKQSTG